MKLLKKFLVLVLLSGSLFFVTNVDAQRLPRLDLECYEECRTVTEVLCTYIYVPTICDDNGDEDCFDYCLPG